MKLKTFVCLTFVLILSTLSLSARAQNAAGYAAVTIDSGYVGEDYSQNVEQTLKDKYKLKLRGASRTPTLEWVAVDPLPPGLAIDPATGQIFGTPARSRPQPYQFRLHVVDTSVANPSALKLQLNMKIMRGPRPGPAPTLEPIETTDATVEPQVNGGGNGGGNGAGNANEAASHQLDNRNVAPAGSSSADVEIHAIEPKETTTLAMTIKNFSIRQIEVLVKDKEGEQVDSAKTPDDLPRGEVQTSVNVKLKEGSNTLEVRNADTGELYSTIPVTLGRTATAQEKPPTKPQEKPKEPKKIKIEHSGIVPRGAITTAINIVVDDEITNKAMKISVKEKKGTDPAKNLPNYYPDPIELKRGKKDYNVVIPVSTDPDATTIVAVVGINDKDKEEPPVTKEIKRGEASGLPKVEVGYSRFVNNEATSAPLQITVNDPKINRLKVIVRPVLEDKKQVAPVTYGDIFNIGRGEDGVLKVIGLPSDKEIEVSLYDVSESKLTDKEEEDVLDEKYVPEDHIVQTLLIERRSGGAPASTIDTNSLNTRAIIGFEQAGASSADSESKPFLDFFFTAPLRFKPADDLLPRFSAWGQVRLAAVPEQVSNFGTYASNFVNPLAENKLTSLVQGFDFLAGLEARVFGTNKPYLSLIPGVKHQTFFHIVGGGGAISPLSASDTRSRAQIFAVPDKDSPQRALFEERFGKDAAAKDYIAFVFPERDRFLRQFYGGVRLKTFYFNDDGTLINRFPAILDFMIGQNEAVTGGRLQSDVTDENGKLIGRKRRYVLRLEAFYPLPIKQASFLYLFGTAMMKIGGGGVKIDTPLFLDTPGSEVSITSNDVFIVPTLQTNRDYYRIGIGINLTDLFNRRPTSDR